MEFKDLIGFALFGFGTFGAVLVTCASKKARDVFFVLMVFLAPMTERFDINFVSRDWYRGTTRGFECSLVDILSLSLLLATVLVPRRGVSRAFWPASLGTLLLLFFYACLNVAVSEPRLFGLFELHKMLRGLVIFLAVAFYLRSERELRLLLFTLGLLVCFEGLMALKQRYVDGIHRVSGTIADSNSLSVFFCTTVPVLVAAFSAHLPRTLKLISAAGIALASVGVILTISRMGVITLATVLVGAILATTSLRLTVRKIAIALVLVVGASAITAKSWKTLKVRFAESDAKTEYGNKRLLGRGYYIRVAISIATDRLFGVGLNNWSYWVSNKYGPRLGYKFVPYKGTDKEPSSIIPVGSNVDIAQAAPAHSIGALTLGELGIPGLCLFLLMWGRWFQMGFVFLWNRTPDPVRRIGVGLFFALTGLFLHSMTEWVFRQSPMYYVVHILVGALASLYYLRRQEARAVVPQPVTLVKAEVYAPLPAES